MKKKRWFTFFGILMAIFLWSALLYRYHPEKIVGMIGINNGYIASFLIALFGEAATFSFISVYPAIITLAAGGLNPIALGIIAGLGMTAGNMLYYYLGYRGKEVLTEKYEHKIDRLLRWMEKEPCWIIQLVIFLYVAFTPLPNNLLTVACGVADHRWKRLLPPLIIGNIVLCTYVSYFAVLGIKIF
ncbi:TPA: hypothetical protein HA265_05410 [Candidatus Woesearchaeota archaeon]|nr:hypothetical protein [Candidatus Woesearchaeota archaeon]